MTTTTTSQATQVYQIFIKATPERIWEAITTPEFTGSSTAPSNRPGGSNRHPRSGR